MDFVRTTPANTVSELNRLRVEPAYVFDLSVFIPLLRMKGQISRQVDTQNLVAEDKRFH